MIKTEMLRAFVAVAEAGSLVEGAAALGRTPSAVSETLKRLEAEVGRPLFEGERKNRLTALGAFTLSAGKRELDHHARTVKAIGDFAAARTGEVRIAAVPSYACAELPGLAVAFRHRHPDIRLQVRDMDSAAIHTALARGRIDLGIVSDPRPDSGMRSTRLGSDAFGLVMRVDDPLAGRARMVCADLGRVQLLANPLCERIASPDLQAALADAPLRATNTTTLLAMVRAGLGVTVLPELVMHAGVPDLAFVPLESPTAWRELHLQSRKGETASPASAAFAAFAEAWAMSVSSGPRAR